MVKKAQAAVEFLMTYGWAILMIMVIVGAFAYLGFTNPLQFIQDKCTLSPGFDCAEIGWIEDANAPGEVYVGLFLKNRLEEDIRTIEDGYFEGDCEPADNRIILGEHTVGTGYKIYTNGTKIERKISHLLLFSCPDIPRSQKVKILFELPYRELRTTFNQTLEGEITIQGASSYSQYTLITP